jgi:hypothetical protein
MNSGSPQKLLSSRSLQIRPEFLGGQFGRDFGGHFDEIFHLNSRVGITG